VNETVDYGIWYSRDTNLNLSGYSNADWARSIDDKKVYLWWVLLCGDQSCGVDEQEVKFYLSIHS
jgi:hypothetical protein